MRTSKPTEPVRPGIALVTGASSGFGMLTAVALAQAGYQVVASMRDLSRQGQLRAALDAVQADAHTVALDVTKEESIHRALDEVAGKADGEGISVLVNNAGFGLGGAVEDLSMAEFREQFETNFFGLVAVTKAVLPGMRERRCGRIINVSSVSGRMAWPGMAAYSASKFAVEGFSEALRHELLPYDVYVSLVEPGLYRTNIFERNRRVAARSSDPTSPWFGMSTRVSRFIDQRVEGSTADPAEVAELIVDIASARRPRLRYVAGKSARAQTVLHRTLPPRVWESAIQRALGLRKISAIPAAETIGQPGAEPQGQS